MSPRFRNATSVALALQIPIAIVCLLLLDGGRVARVCGAAMLGFWIVAGIIAFRRRWSPTAGDLLFWRWGFVGCFALAALMAAAMAAGGETEGVVYAAKFDEKLDDGWGWVREDPKAWRLEQGKLVVVTSGGGLWKEQNSCRNILLRDPPKDSEGYAVEALIEAQPAGSYEHAGLVWYVDDDTYASLLYEKVSQRRIVQLVLEKERVPKVGFAEKPFDDERVWLRMEVAGGKVRGSFRAPDEKEWRLLGEADLPGKAAGRVGLCTGYGVKDSGRVSRFSGFRIVPIGK